MNCESYIQFHKKNEFKNAKTQFRQSSLFKDFHQSIANKLHVPIESLSHDTLLIMYLTCAYDSVKFGVKSDWCTLLGDEGIKVD